jgi:hypothetical protein
VVAYLDLASSTSQALANPFHRYVTLDRDLQAPGPAQVVVEDTPLTYLNIGVYKLPQGGAFNFSTWTGTGGVAYTLNVNN